MRQVIASCKSCADRSSDMLRNVVAPKWLTSARCQSGRRDSLNLVQRATSKKVIILQFDDVA